MQPEKKNASSAPISVSQPDLSEADARVIMARLASQDLSIDARMAAFEAGICEFTGSRYAITVSSSTTAILLCLRAAGIGKGDLVITTPFAPHIPTKALLAEDAVPIFVDLEPRTGNIDPHLVFAAAQDIMQGGKNAQAWLPPIGASVEGQLKAIMPVEISGQLADLELILNTAWKYKVKVIEEASDAMGAAYRGHPAGTFGDYGAFGFHFSYPTITAECGMVITDDPEAESQIRAMHKQGPADGKNKVDNTPSNIGYQPDELSAALGLAYVQRLDELIAKRNQVAQWYNQRLAEIAAVEAPTIAKYTTRASWSTYVIRLASGINRQTIAKKLDDLGVPSQPYYQPIHLQPGMVERFGYREGTFPVAEDLGRCLLVLPFSGAMDESQVDKVCEALRQVIL
jgi:perosamine synthetase